MFKFVLSLLLTVAVPVLADDTVQGSKNGAGAPPAAAAAATSPSEAKAPASEVATSGYACTMSKMKRTVSVA